MAEPRERSMLRWMRIVAVVLGILHALLAAWQHEMNPDGVCYLDMGDAFVRADWRMAISPVWSPLYPLVLGGVQNLVNPGMRWEYPLVHLVNLVIYLFALWSFDRLWAELTRWREQRCEARGGAPWVGLPKTAWIATGYGIFTFAALGMIEVRLVTPDMLMAALTLLAARMMLRARQENGRRLAWIVFGALLGLGYLAKSVMFPMGLVFLVASALPTRTTAPRPAGGGRARLQGVLLALVAFVVVAAPWVTVLSVGKGRFTFGEAGRITYAKYATDLRYPHWQGLTPRHGVPEHPSRQLMTDPDVFEFAEPIGGTYPIAYDSSYWYEGLRPSFHALRQAGVIADSGYQFVGLFVRRFGVVFFVVVVFLALSRGSTLRQYLGDLEWSLILPGVAGLALYSAVLSEERYLAVFAVLILSAVLSGMPAPAEGDSRAARAAAWAMVAIIWVNIAIFNSRMALEAVSGNPVESPQTVERATIGVRSVSWRVAEALRSHGVVGNDKIGYIGNSGRASFWARLARVRIIAEITESQVDRFWLVGEERRAAALAAFRRAGVVAVVAGGAPAEAFDRGWQRLGNGGLAIYRFKEPGAEESP